MRETGRIACETRPFGGDSRGNRGERFSQLLLDFGPSLRMERCRGIAPAHRKRTAPVFPDGESRVRRHRHRDNDPQTGRFATGTGRVGVGFGRFRAASGAVSTPRNGASSLVDRSLYSVVTPDHSDPLVIPGGNGPLWSGLCGAK